MSEVLQPVVINGRFLQRSVTGVERFATEILVALDNKISNGQSELPPLVIAVPPGTQPAIQFKNLTVVEVGSRQGHAWEQWDLLRYSAGKFLVNLCNTAPAIKKHQVVVIHDAAVFAVPAAYGAVFKLVYKIMHRTLATVGAHIWTVSEFSKAQLQHFLGLNPQNILVLPEGGEHVLRLPPDHRIQDKAGLTHRPYVLAVSSAQLNKNFGFVAKALATMGDPGFDVAVAGGANPSVFVGKGETLPTFVKHLGYVSDAELASLYQKAACFVFPSLYEGFGIPPLEAMAHGCPVVAANAASIPEVCGDAAVYFDPRDAQSFLTALNSVMTQPVLQQKLQANARTRSEHWSWARAAQTLHDGLLRALKTKQ